MSKEEFNQRKIEFIEKIKKEKRLPKAWEFSFSYGDDMRIWFDKISKLEQFKSFVNEVNTLLASFNKKVLTDKEREEEFLNCTATIKRIPMKGEVYFSDNTDMYTWYISYKNRNKSFETIVYISLPEYEDFDLVTVWPQIKQEFINVLKTIKRVPNLGEVILQNDIDVRVVYDKLKSHDPVFFEKLLLHMQSYKEKKLSEEDRIKELKEAVSTLGYIPVLQQARFSDGADMFTWYTRYKEQIPNLEEDLKSLVTKELPPKKVNIYLIPNFRKTGGKFYTICTNVGEVLDLSNITSLEEAMAIDPTIVKRGGLILKRDEEIGSVSFGKGRTKK